MAPATNVFHERAQTLFQRLRLCICIATVIGLGAFTTCHVFAITDGDDAANQETTAELVWKSGDRLPGRAIGLTDRRIVFESALFRDPLQIDVDWLKSFEPNKASKTLDSDETFAVYLVDGQMFLADIKKLDEDVLIIESKRAGKLEIDRTRIASVINQKVSQILVTGTVDFDRWDAKRGDKRYWKQNDNGDAVATRDDIHLFFESELPESCLIDLEIAWDTKLDFVLALGIPLGARSLDSVPRLESWDGSIVFNHDDDFEIVLAEIDEDVDSLKLLVHWNQKTNKVVIHDETGTELASAELSKSPKPIKPGIFLQNKTGDLRIKSIGIRSAAPGFDPSQTSIQLKSNATINATMSSFDGLTWTASDNDGEPVEIAAEDFVGAFHFNPESKLESGVGDTLRFQDGEKVIGKLIAIGEDTVTIETVASSQPIILKSDRLKQIKFDPRAKPSSDESFNHVLISDAGSLRGRLENGDPTDGNVLFWRVEGGSESVPFASSFVDDGRVNAKVILEQDKESKVEIEEWPDTLFLNNRDLLPVRFRSANETEIVVESFFENSVVPGASVRAVEFGTRAQTDKTDFSDSAWVKSPKARLSKGKFKLKEGDAIGHPNLMGRGGFEFELDWSSGKYGVLNIDFGRSLDEQGKLKEESPLSFAIILYANQYSVAANNENQNPQGVKAKGTNPVKFRVAVEKNRIVVYAKNKKCYTKKIDKGFGRSVSMRLNDMWDQNINCTLSNLDLPDGYLSGEFIDSERKELILTIPRLKARNPPGQILCASNSDLARGNIVSIDEDHVMFRTNSSVNRYPRDILDSIVWIDTESLIASLAADETGESENSEPEANESTNDAAEPKQKQIPNDPSDDQSSPENGQVAQVLMRGGRRVTLTLDRWADETLIGHSELLGACEIPFKQIYEIRMGKFATDATDVPWSDWIAKLAPKPKLDGNNGAGQEDSSLFGSGSPLIGKRPILTFKMLDGEKVKLDSLQGKVVVLDFWATWCGPCVKSLPGVLEVVASYPESSVVLITVNQNESKANIKSFLKTRNLEFQVALDEGEISEAFNVEAIPQTVIIDAAGKIQFVKVGASNDMEKKLRIAIDSLLDAKAN